MGSGLDISAGILSIIWLDAEYMKGAFRLLRQRWLKMFMITVVSFVIILPLTYLSVNYSRNYAPLALPDPGSEGSHDATVSGPNQPLREPKESVPAPVEEKDTVEEETPGSGENRELALQLFFADGNAVVGAEPREFGFVAPVTRIVPFQSGVLRLALQELIRGPLAEDGSAGRTLAGNTRILNLEIKDGVAIIDFSDDVFDQNMRGSLHGIIFMQSIVYTATQFPTVESVQVLVTGHPWEDGHFYWDKPLSRSDLSVQASH
jgi:spore germination protein GerM